MLVLSRQRDETIMIGDEVEVTIVDIRGDKVRLGISAPREITVHRKEVYEAIKRENHAAAKVRPEDLSVAGNGQGPRLVSGSVDGEAVRPTIRATSPQAVRPGNGRRGGNGSSNGNGSGNGSRRTGGPRPPEGSMPLAPTPAPQPEMPHLPDPEPSQSDEQD